MGIGSGAWFLVRKVAVMPDENNTNNMASAQTGGAGSSGTVPEEGPSRAAGSAIPMPPVPQAAPTSAPGVSGYGNGSTQPYQSAQSYSSAPSSPAGSPYSNGYSPADIPSSPVMSKPQKKSVSRVSIVITAIISVLLGLAIGGGITGFVAYKVFGGSSANSDFAASTDSSGSITITPVSDDATLAEVVSAKALPSVVSIDVYSNSSSYYGYSMGSSSSSTLAGLGSGIILTEDGYILTNYHVVEGSTDLIVNIDETEYKATVTGSDESSDLAVIKIDAHGLTPIEIGSSNDLRVGEWVMALGSPFGLEKSVSTGIVSALYRSTSMSSSTGISIYANMIQTDAAINPGNSGGALVDSEGKLIGVNTLIESASGSSSGVGFAIPVDYAMKVAEQLKQGKMVEHSYLGVSLASVTAQNAGSANLSVDSGAYIANVVSGSGAASAGLQKGDVITGIDGDKITTASEAIIAVRSHDPGDSIEVTYVRGNDTKTVSVTLGSDASADAESSSNTQPQQQQNSYFFSFGS